MNSVVKKKKPNGYVLQLTIVREKIHIPVLEDGYLELMLVLTLHRLTTQPWKNVKPVTLHKAVNINMLFIHLMVTVTLKMVLKIMNSVQIENITGCMHVYL